MLLILKAIGRPASTVAVYHLETERLNAIILTGELDNGRGHAEFHAFPKNGKPYTMNTIAFSSTKAVEPIILTVERLLEE